MRSTHHVRKIALGAFVVTSLFGPRLSAQANDIQWTRSLKFSASDKRDIVALAKSMGVDAPARVDANLRDDCCRIVSITSRVVENGPERRWTRASMVRDSWREYADAPRPQDSLRVGRWIADRPSEVFAEWRVRDGSWFVDVGFDRDRPSVPYREAELIVLAVRHGTVVNRIPDGTYPRRSQPSIPTLNQGGRYTIRKRRSEGDASPNEYEISIATGRDGGVVLRMRIVGDTVEAVSLMSYVV